VPKSASAIQAIQECIRALCLNKDGLESIKHNDPVRKLFALLANVDYLGVLNSNQLPEPPRQGTR
jgi:hypothetical protein